jgi:hypothetical protein
MPAAYELKPFSLLVEYGEWVVPNEGQEGKNE